MNRHLKVLLTVALGVAGILGLGAASQLQGASIGGSSPAAGFAGIGGSGVAPAVAVKPILLGADSYDYTDSLGNKQDKRTQSNAVAIGFFKHPKTAAGNFTKAADECFDVGEEYEPLCIGDVIAVPGPIAPRLQGELFPENTTAATAAASLDPMIEQLPLPASGSGLSFVHGVGIEFLIFNLNDPPGSPAAAGFRLVGQFTNKNKRSYMFELVDIREPKDDSEFEDIFGVVPLEDVLLLGNGFPQEGEGDDVRYSEKFYPAGLVDGKRPGNLCLHFTPAADKQKADASFAFGYCDDKLKDNKIVGDEKSRNFQKWFPVDSVNLQSGSVAISYDPLISEILPRGGLFKGSVEAWQPPNNKAGDLSLLSPLSFFRNISDRYAFSGYLNFDFQSRSIKVNIDLSNQTIAAAVLGEFIKSYRALDTNSMEGFKFTNPVAIESLYSGDYLGVVHQTTIGDLRNCVLTDYGRCEVFDDGEYHTMEEVLGTANNGDAGSFKSLKGLNRASAAGGDGLYYDGVVSTVLFWKQWQKWGSDPAKYETLNPASFMTTYFLNPSSDPMDQFIYTSALVQEGALDAAVVNDVGNKQLLVVPAREFLYFIDPIDGERLYRKDKFKQGIKQLPLIKSDLILPDVVKLDYTRSTIGLPSSNLYSLYQADSGNLDGDECQDLVLTWRGKKVKRPKVFKDSSAPNEDYFFSGDDTNMNLTSAMCSNTITVVYRILDPATNKCIIGDVVNNYSLKLPRQICSAIVDDFDKDGYEDILAGSAMAEQISETPDKCSSYAYLMRKGSPVDVVKVRTGFAEGEYKNETLPEEKGTVAVCRHGEALMPGVSKLVKGENGEVAAITGFPMVYRPMDACPADDPAAVYSFYEIADSIEKAIDAYYNHHLMLPPFYTGTLGTDAKISTQRCAEKPPCILCNTPFPLNLEDRCCDEKNIYEDWCKKDLLGCDGVEPQPAFCAALDFSMCPIIVERIEPVLEVKEFKLKKRVTDSLPNLPQQQPQEMVEVEPELATPLPPDQQGSGSTPLPLVSMPPPENVLKDVMGYDIPLPKAHPPGGLRETTAIAWKQLKPPPAACNKNGVMDNGETGVDCGGALCPACPVGTCNNNGVMDNGETGIDCGGGNCPLCVIVDEAVNASGKVKTYCDVSGMSEGMKAFVKDRNDAIRKVMQEKAIGKGKNFDGDGYCPDIAKWTAIVVASGTSYPGKDLSGVSFSSSVQTVPGDTSNIGAWALLQDSGTEFLNWAAIGGNEATIVSSSKPVILAPYAPKEEAAKSLKSVIMPNLDSAAVPLANSSDQVLSDGSVVRNNVFQYSVMATKAGQGYNVATSDGSFSISLTSASAAVDAPGATILRFMFTLSPDMPVAGMPVEASYVENRMLDFDKYLNELGNYVSTHEVSSPAGCDLPWEKNLTYKFTYVQNAYAKTAADPTEVREVFGVISGAPSSVSGGGGCGCNTLVSLDTASLASFIATFFAFISTLGVLAVARRRKR